VRPSGPVQVVLANGVCFRQPISKFFKSYQESVSMNPTTIRIIAGVLFVVFVLIIVARRKSMASKRKRVA
jgi:hypothetical protein